ncbi:MAG: hypothetical protein CL946_11480 [Ectothiorhodospiraceae bacterium]|nr:hypothetical protein [Ectothiorhodospiraceae bacterium]
MRALLLLLAFLATASSTLAQLDVEHYRAEIAFDLDEETLDGVADVRFSHMYRGDISAIQLHVRDLTISNVVHWGEQLHYVQEDDFVMVKLAAPLHPADTMSVTLEYEGHATNEGGSQPWGGCHWNSADVTFSMGVGFRAPYVSMTRHWLPSNDIPSDKATFDVTFTVPKPYTVAGAGLLEEVIDHGDAISYRWVETHQTATYLFNYSISQYAVVRDEWNGIPMEYYVPKADSAKGAHFFSTVHGMMDAFTAAFGPYRFDKIGYCITPIGAMEHQTMISYPLSLFTLYDKAGETAAHELAHQWWGDWVTPLTFEEAWLSEGFAVFAEAVYQEHLNGRSGYVNIASGFATNYRRNIARAEGVFPLYDFPREAPSSNYPQTIYEKGGSVLVMLRLVMGDDKFFEGLRDYGERNSYENATTAEFQHVMEEHHAGDLSWFFDQWVYQAGWPEYEFEILAGAGEEFTVRVLQMQDTTEYPLFQMPIPVTIVTTAHDTLTRTMNTEALQSSIYTFPGIRAEDVLIAEFDPDRLILAQRFTSTVTVADPQPTPRSLLLYAPFPNPAYGRTLYVPFELGSPGHVEVHVYDTLGKHILSFPGRDHPSGKHQLRLHVDSLPPGSYWLHMTAGSKTALQEIVLR